MQFSLTEIVEKIVRSRMMWADHSVWTEEGQVTRCGRRRARSLGVNGRGPGHTVWTEEGQVTRCEWKRARSLGVNGKGPGHTVWTEESQVTRCGRRRARSLGVNGRGPGHTVWTEEGRLPKKADAMKQPGCMEMGRAQLRWEDSVKRVVRKAEEEDGGRMLSINGKR